MKKHFLFLASLLTACSASHAQVAPACAARLQYVLDSTCSRYHIKGASAAVYLPGSGMWTGVHGESYAGHPITPSMAFPLNSNTKTYTAALLLKLQEDGLLHLSDTIGNWIHDRPNISGQVTIRQLLNHTSGIYSYTDTPAFSDSVFADFTRRWQPEDMLQFVGPPLFPAGASWSYSNTNYLLAGMIIAQVTGMPAEQAFRSRLLNPQGLCNTWFFPQEAPAATIPHFWFFNGSGIDDGATFGYMPAVLNSAASTAGALFSTAEDNAQFWHRLLSGQIVGAVALSQWRQTVQLSANVGYGLGVICDKSVNGHVVYEHGGGGAGTLNENLADSVSGVCISLLTNQDSASNQILFEQVVMALHKVTLEVPVAVAAAGNAPQFMVYPNPAREELRLSFAPDAGEDCSYAITDAAGKLLKRGTLTGGKASIRIEDLQDETYYLQLSAGGRVLGGRAFTVQK